MLTLLNTLHKYIDHKRQKNKDIINNMDVVKVNIICYLKKASFRTKERPG
jgi:hypothetical protein